MSKKLFAALSLSVLLAACQGSVTTPTTDDSMATSSDAAMMDDTTSSAAMMDDTTSADAAMSEDSSVSSMDDGATASVDAGVDANVAE